MSTRPWLKFYDPQVPQSLQYPQTDLYSAMSLKAKECATRPAVRFMGLTLTYEALFAQVESLAASLYSRGIRQGDTVVLLMPEPSSVHHLLLCPDAPGEPLPCSPILSTWKESSFSSSRIRVPRP